MARLKVGPQPELSRTVPAALCGEDNELILSQRLKNENWRGEKGEVLGPSTIQRQEISRRPRLLGLAALNDGNAPLRDLALESALNDSKVSSLL